MLMNYILLAIPLFIFMGDMIQYSGIADRLYETLYVALGPVRGGLALATVLFGTVLAACLGIIAASVSMLCILGLTPMVKRGYAKDLACGAVAAGGCLGILIPPSIMIVMYGPIANVSVGKLFMGAFPAGAFLALLYCIYISVRALVRPKDAPALPKEERTTPTGKKIRDLLISLVPPVLLILSVLGVIFFGIAAPTEAAGMGAFASVLLAIAYRRFSFKVFKYVALDTLKVSGYIFFLSCLTYAAIGVFMRLGCADVIGQVILSTPGGKWAIFGVIMFFILCPWFYHCIW
jgi:tripartite ATP-independent transporter DctM subunit